MTADGHPHVRPDKVIFEEKVKSSFKAAATHIVLIPILLSFGFALVIPIVLYFKTWEPSLVVEMVDLAIKIYGLIIIYYLGAFSWLLARRTVEIINQKIKSKGGKES